MGVPYPILSTGKWHSGEDKWSHKNHAKVSKGNWSARLAQAVFIVNSRWGGYGSPKIKAFCPAEPAMNASQVQDEPEGNTPPSLLRIQAGQPVLVKLPSIGVVSMTLAKPRGLYAWEAVDINGKTHRISARWIIPDY